MSIKNMTKVRRAGAGLLAFTLMGVVAAGCSQGDTQEESSTPSSEATLLFKDPSTSGPRLDVYEVEGQAAISVGGPIGTEATLARATGTESIEELYRAIHPDAAEVPSELVALDARLAPALAQLRELASTRADAVAFEPPQLDKNQAAFNSTVCKNFAEGSERYTPVECPFKASGNEVSIFQWPLSINAADRTYGWNPNPRSATISWWAFPPNAAAYVAWSITLPQYWWNWMSIYSGGPYSAVLRSAGGINGELGLTHHRFRRVL